MSPNFVFGTEHPHFIVMQGLPLIDACAAVAINQSKILTEPHTGMEKPIPALPQGGSKPCVTK